MIQVHATEHARHAYQIRAQAEAAALLAEVRQSHSPRLSSAVAGRHARYSWAGASSARASFGGVDGDEDEDESDESDDAGTWHRAPTRLGGSTFGCEGRRSTDRSGVRGSVNVPAALAGAAAAASYASVLQRLDGVSDEGGMSELGSSCSPSPTTPSVRATSNQRPAATPPTEMSSVRAETAAGETASVATESVVSRSAAVEADEEARSIAQAVQLRRQAYSRTQSLSAILRIGAQYHEASCSDGHEDVDDAVDTAAAAADDDADDAASNSSYWSVSARPSTNAWPDHWHGKS